MLVSRDDAAQSPLVNVYCLGIKIQSVLRSAETAAMPLWALLATDQIAMRKVAGWQTQAGTPLLNA